MKRTRIGFLLQPWAGLAGGVSGWLAHHQVISDALHVRCPAGNPASAVIVGAAAVAFIALAALWSRAVLREDESAPVAKGKASPRRPEQRNAAGSRAFAARLSLMAAALFALLVLVQTMAGLMLPGCPP